jgi:hypothetical protein
MISFSKDLDKNEGIVKSIVAPDISRIQSDESLNQIKDNNFEIFSDLTVEIFKNLILSFEIFQMPPLLGIFNDFPLILDYSKQIFKQEMSLKNPDAYVNLINNLFSLFDPSKNPSGDLVQLLAPLTIQFNAILSKEISNDEINNILNVFLEKNLENFKKEDLNNVCSYGTYYIVKFLAMNFLLQFNLPPPAAPIILPLIEGGGINTQSQMIRNEFNIMIEKIINSINNTNNN